MVEAERTPSIGVEGDWRETERGRMLKTLRHLLRIARQAAANKEVSEEMRLRWVNTMCYITQTWNSVLKDADFDMLKREVERTQEEVSRLNEKKH